MQGREAVEVRGRELEIAALGQIEAGQGEPEAFGKGQGVDNGNPHIGNSHLGHHRAVDIFHHRMNDALGMDQDLDLFHRGAEKPMGLDHLQPFVHQGGGVNGDFFAHGPVGMVKGLLRGDLPQFPGRFVTEGAARGGEDDPGHILLAAGGEGLGHGAVFAVDGQQLYPLPRHRRHHQLPGHHQGFLVGQGDILARLDRGQGGGEAGRSDNGRNHQFRFGQGGHQFIAFPADQHPVAPARRQALDEIAGHILGHRDQQGMKGLDLVAQQLDVVARRHPHDPEAAGILAHHVEDVAADGAGGTEQGDVFTHGRGHFPWPNSSR